MEDIKTLYHAARSSGRPVDIEKYLEAVDDLLMNKPNEYLLNLEYIISSTSTLNTLDTFIEKYGLSLASYGVVMKYLESAIKKCGQQAKDNTPYLEATRRMESFKNKYKYNFIMFEAFEDNLELGYVNHYYERDVPLIKTLDKQYRRFGNVVIPDAIIESVKNDTVDQLLTIFENSKLDAITYQWILECMKDIEYKEDHQAISEKSLDGIYDVIKSRKHLLFRESVLTGNNDIMIEYSPEEVVSMENLISFKEYMMTCLENTDEIMDVQKQIYSLYEEFEGLVEDTTDNVLPMLPSQKPVSPMLKEQWAARNTTTNKTSGQMPGYIKKNHSLGYGEDDGKSKSTSDDEPEPSLDDFKRPSTVATDTTVEELKDDIKSATTPEEKQQAINNYYYYTYTNSNNVTNSHNTNKKSVDNSKSVDDHSIGKRINSDDINQECDEEFSEGSVVLGAILGIVLFPIILGGISVTALGISKSKDNKAIGKTISSILGKGAGNNHQKYISAANKEFQDLCDKNKRTILGGFYKPEKTKSKINKIDACWGSLSNKKDASKVTFSEDNLAFAANDVVTGVIKKTSVKAYVDKLNRLSSDIKFSVTELDLPGDDSGGAWTYLHDAGVISSHPELQMEEYKDKPEEEYEKAWAALSKEAKSCEYCAVDLVMILPAKKFLLDNFSDAKTESVSFELESIMELPLSEPFGLYESIYQDYLSAVDLFTEDSLAVPFPGLNRKSIESSPSFLDKAKEVLRRIWDFILNILDKVFPKTIAAFNELEKKFNASEKIKERLKINNDKLIIMKLEAPNTKGVDVAIRDIAEYLNTSRIPEHDGSYYQSLSNTGPGRKIAIWFGAAQTYASPAFRISSSGGFGELERMHGKDDVDKMSATFSEGHLLEAFGVKLILSRDIGFSSQTSITELRMLVSMMRSKILRDRFSGERNLNTLVLAGKAISGLLDIIVRTMSSAYRSAVQVLNKVENELTESAPWELESFFQLSTFQKG